MLWYSLCVVLIILCYWYKSFQAFRKAVELGVADSTGQKVIETYEFLIDKVILRNGSRLHDAMELVNQALQTYPKYARLFAMKGVLLYKLNQTKAAVEHLEIAVKSNYHSVDTFYHLGLSYEQLGDERKAEDMFKSTLAVDGHHIEAMYHLGRVVYHSAAVRSAGEKSKRLRESEG